MGFDFYNVWAYHPLIDNASAEKQARFILEEPTKEGLVTLIVRK